MSVSTFKYVAYGQNQGLITEPPYPIVAKRVPTVNDKAQVGTIWADVLTNQAFVLTSVRNNIATWINFAGGAGLFTSITVNPGPFTFTGTGAFTVNTTGAILMDSTANSHLTVTNANLTVETVTGNLTLEANGAGNTITIDAAGAGAAIDIESNTGGTTITSTGVININSDDTGGNAIIINANDPGNAGNILMTTSGGIIELSTQGGGEIFLQAVEVTTVGAAGNAASAYMGVMTQTGLLTGAGASQVITITTTVVTVNSGILVSAANKGANDAQMTVTRVVPAAGSFTVTVKNNGAAALNGDLIISFMIISV
jgi:hypothetical protein